jgi:transposase InsO family protein
MVDAPDRTGNRDTPANGRSLPDRSRDPDPKTRSSQQTNGKTSHFAPRGAPRLPTGTIKIGHYRDPQPEGNGCIERFFRTLKEELLWMLHFETHEPLQQTSLEFKDTYKRRWLIERLGYKSPWQARQDVLA